MNKLTENLDFDVALTAAKYITAVAASAAASEIDIVDAQNVVMIVDAGTVGEVTTPVTVTLQGSDTSGSGYADLTATDDSTATVTLTAAGAGQVEIRAEELKRYLKVNVEELDESGAADTFSVILVSGNYGTLPVSQNKNTGGKGLNSYPLIN